MSWHPLIGVGGVGIFAVLWFSLVAVGYRRGTSSLALATGGQATPVLTTLRRLLMGTALVAILLGPAVPGEDIEVSSNVEIFLAVDRTGSMAAEDWEDGQPRLNGVSRDMQELVKATPGARYSVVTWDSTVRIELPVTTDSSAVTSLAAALHQEISEFSAGSSLNRPVGVLLDTLQDSALSRPENQRYLVIFSDGEDTDSNDQGLEEAWKEVAQLVDGGAVLGYGTAEGGPMRVFITGSGPQDDYMEDPDEPGTLAVSRLDEPALAELASVLGLPLKINPHPDQIAEIGSSIMEGATSLAEERGMEKSYQYIIWPVALIFAALLTWEGVSVARYLIYLRRTHAL